MGNKHLSNEDKARIFTLHYDAGPVAIARTTSFYPGMP